MKQLHLLVLSCLLSVVNSCSSPAGSKSADYPITPVDFTRVHLEEGFWKQWVETAKTATIPYAFAKCEETGRIDNFRFAAGLEDGKFRGRFGFDDSDVYKIIEGASYALMLEEDAALEQYLDMLVGYIAGAQEADGYLYTPWTLRANNYNEFACCSYSDGGQWTGTSGSSHEFYNAGHMYEAAVAHFLATGKRSFLDVALKNASLIHDVCITQGHPYVPGHQEIEIGLVKLYRVTGEKKYLELAKHLLDLRASVKDDAYSQAHLPVTEQREAVGHAVRANYMYSAMADVAALTGDTSYMRAVEGVWENVAGRKLSVTGGVGASHRGEAYGENYELPNRPYNETCAAIANVYWNHRMFLLSGDSRHMDILERTLYNGLLAGLSLNGTTFFYPNTLRHNGTEGFNRGANGRSPWFDCSCCPSNLSRFIPSVAGYAYAKRENEVYVNLFLNGSALVEIPNGSLTLMQSHVYPWEGRVGIRVGCEQAVAAKIHIRIPGWAVNQPVPSNLFRFHEQVPDLPVISVNGQHVSGAFFNGYVTLDRQWEDGDRISLHLPMSARKILAHEKVSEKRGLVALQYGPLVYCAEETDNQVSVLDATIGMETTFEAEFEPDILGGVNTLEGGELMLVPYYAWANRGTGEMNVWFRQ